MQMLGTYRGLCNIIDVNGVKLGTTGIRKSSFGLNNYHTEQSRRFWRICQKASRGLNKQTYWQNQPE